MLISEKSSSLDLDPGASRRKRGSALKFILWTGGIISLIFVAKFLFSSIHSMTHFSHNSVFQNETWAEVKNHSLVVRPLIDDEQTFDVVVTVWQRTTTGEQLRLMLEDARGRVNNSMALEKSRDETKPLDSATLLYMDTYARKDVYEKAIHSSIAFRGIRLKDKDLATVINLTEVPTAVFREHSADKNTLRASFVLVPTSPSLLDSVHDYSSWLPSYLSLPRVIPFPFPLGSTDTKNWTIQDRALESFGINVPLLDFHKISSRCPTSRLGEPDDEGGYGNTWDGIHQEDLVTKHPHVITRTQIRVVDETHLFNKREYDKAHQKLKATSCGRDLPGSHASLDKCTRMYMFNGNWETRLELKIPNNDTESGYETQWAYAPYLQMFGPAAGPQDIIPVPVNRENCSPLSPNDGQEIPNVFTDQEFMNITWRLSFSGRTPGKFVMGEVYGRGSWVTVKHDVSGYQKQVDHYEAERLNGLFGHRYHEDAHPRRVFFLSAVRDGLYFFQTVLDMIYWYTRTSTVGISIPGTAMSAIGDLIDLVADIRTTARKNNLTSNQWEQWLWLLIKRAITTLLAPLLMLKAITRLDIQVKRGWIPHFKRASPTHLERASERLDARISWGLRGAILIGLFSVYYLFKLHDYFVIPPNIPLPTAEDWTREGIWDLTSTLLIAGLLSQIYLNYRSRHFSGYYKAEVIIIVLRDIIGISLFVPAISGRYDARWGMTVHDVVKYSLHFVLLFQAVVLPSRSRDNAEEDKDSE